MLEAIKIVFYALSSILMFLVIAVLALIVLMCIIAFLSELRSAPDEKTKLTPRPPNYTFDHTKTFPVQGHTNKITWSVAAYIHEEQKRRGLTPKSLKALKLEGGYDVATLDEFYPLWRLESELVKQQQIRIQKLEKRIIDTELRAKISAARIELGEISDHPELRSNNTVEDLRLMHRRAQKAESRVEQLEKELQKMRNDCAAMNKD